MKTLNAYIPENLNLLQLLADYPPSFDYNVDVILRIVSLISEVKGYSYDEYSVDDYVLLNAEKIRKQGIRKFKNYKDWLISNQVIETDNQYIVGEKSIGYRFSKKYRTSLIVDQIKNRTLIRAYNKGFTNRVEGRIKQPKLYSWFMGLEIDDSAAIEFLKEKFEKDKANPKKKKRRKYGQKTGFKDPQNIYNISKINVEKIKNKQFFFRIDKTAGRLHTNLTNIVSSVRNFITHKGEKLVTIDIVNCQPLMFTLVLRREFWTSPILDQVLSVTNDTQKTSETFKLLKHMTVKYYSLFNINQLHYAKYTFLSPPMLSKMHECTEDDDVELYVELVEKGCLYEYMEEELFFSESEVSKEIQNRKDIKDVIFSALFSSNDFLNHKDARPKKEFDRMFSNVYNKMELIKEGQKNRLAILLQELESKLMLDCAAKRISKEKPSVPIFTVHDSITTTVGNEDYVKHIIIEEFKRNIGIKPKLKTEYWLPENAYKELNKKNV